MSIFNRINHFQDLIPFQFESSGSRELRGQEFSIHEFNALRNEINQRILIMNNQASSAIGVLLTMWGVGLSIFGIQLAEQSSLPRYIVFVLMFGACLAFFMSQLFLLPMSAKSGENIRQLLSLSTYIKVFYVYPSLHASERNHGNNVELFSWEAADKILNVVFTKPNEYGQPRSFLTKHSKTFFNLEYTLLGLTATIFIIILLCANITHIFASKYCVLLCIICFFLLSASIFIVYVVLKFSSSPSELLALPDLYLKVYLAYANKIGFLDVNEIKKALNELSPNVCLTPDDYERIISNVTS